LTRPEDKPATKAELDAAVDKIERMIRPQAIFPLVMPVIKSSSTNKVENFKKTGIPW